MVTDGTNAHLFQVTHVLSPPENLQHNPSSPYNVPGGFTNWPPGGYGVGAQVFRVNQTSYRLDPQNFRRPSLVRQEVGGTPQIAAWGVERFEVWYRMQDGSLTRAPVDMSLVDKVVPLLVTRVTQFQRPAVIETVRAEVRPRTF
jgi:hypothetical protein